MIVMGGWRSKWSSLGRLIWKIDLRFTGRSIISRLYMRLTSGMGTYMSCSHTALMGTSRFTSYSKPFLFEFHHRYFTTVTTTYHDYFFLKSNEKLHILIHFIRYWVSSSILSSISGPSKEKWYFWKWNWHFDMVLGFFPKPTNQSISRDFVSVLSPSLLPSLSLSLCLPRIVYVSGSWFITVCSVSLWIKPLTLWFHCVSWRCLSIHTPTRT